MAFQAADAKSVSATGNLLLGMNAHVQRDLPFVLEAVGLRASRKRDFDEVNRILDQIYRPLLAEIARRFDPTVNDRDLPTPYDDFAIFQVLPAWRELAWRNAERLKLAPTPAARASSRRASRPTRPRRRRRSAPGPPMRRGRTPARATPSARRITATPERAVPPHPGSHAGRHPGGRAGRNPRIEGVRGGRVAARADSGTKTSSCGAPRG